MNNVTIYKSSIAITSGNETLRFSRGFQVSNPYGKFTGTVSNMSEWKRLHMPNSGYALTIMDYNVDNRFVTIEVRQHGAFRQHKMILVDEAYHNDMATTTIINCIRKHHLTHNVFNYRGLLMSPVTDIRLWFSDKPKVTVIINDSGQYSGMDFIFTEDTLRATSYNPYSIIVKDINAYISKLGKSIL